eukprot:scaffold4331_cov129-Isochrysis_galbana.AAC.3
MGNCATTLREGLQCPHGSVFLYNLGCVRAMAARLVRSSARWRARPHRRATLCTLRYDDTYVWGNALAADQERPTMCIFEAPDNEALFQHAKEYYEGLPGSSLYVRNVLTVGNYDYTQVSAGSPRGLASTQLTRLYRRAGRPWTRAAPDRTRLAMSPPPARASDVPRVA